jgi:endo-1,4-beta-D-glucanase Y
MRQQQAEHEARMRAQQEEIDRQQAELAAERQRQADEAARVEREKQEAIDAEAARVAAEEQRKREEAEAAARAEAERIQAEKDAAEAERQRRERVEFEKNGPGDVEIVAVLADYYAVSPAVARAWLSRHMWALMEKAA